MDDNEHKHNYYGLKAENFFSTSLFKLGIHCKKVPKEWYDFLVYGQKVEVKSCQLSVKQPRKRRGDNGKLNYRPGRFDFTEESNRELQYDENIWVCFIARNNEDFMILGFVRAEELNKKRYVCINKLRELNLLSLNAWMGRISDGL